MPFKIRFRSFESRPHFPAYTAKKCMTRFERSNNWKTFREPEFRFGGTLFSNDLGKSSSSSGVAVGIDSLKTFCHTRQQQGPQTVTVEVGQKSLLPVCTTLHFAKYLSKEKQFLSLISVVEQQTIIQSSVVMEFGSRTEETALCSSVRL